MLTFLSTTLGLAVVAFYFYVAVAFYRHADPSWKLLTKIVFALIWPATVWRSPYNPAR